MRSFRPNLLMLSAYDKHERMKKIIQLVEKNLEPYGGRLFEGLSLIKRRKKNMRLDKSNEFILRSNNQRIGNGKIMSFLKFL